MRIPDILQNIIEESEKDRFQRKLVLTNLQRGKVIAVVVILFEVILIVSDLVTHMLKVDDRFLFNEYLVMYLLMVFANGFCLLLCHKCKDIMRLSAKHVRLLDSGLVLYITFVLCWGSVLTLMDQQLYGQAISYMLNLSICSILFYLDHKKVLFPYLLSALILFLGLPFFQHSSDILIGHYINLTMFLIISWLASRIIYHGYCVNYLNTLRLQNGKITLEKEIDKNKEMNRKLALANQQLKEMTLIDELTGIPNRRSFRNYIDAIFDRYPEKRQLLSVMMIDIDHFKQYNDHYGHEAGDNTLIAVAGQIVSTIESPAEFAARWGGEEFLFAGVYDREDTIARLAETIRRKIMDLHIPHAHSDGKDCVTVSIGIATAMLDSKDDVGKLIQLADKAMYQAKESGRNCVRIAKNS